MSEYSTCFKRSFEWRGTRKVCVIYLVIAHTTDLHSLFTAWYLSASLDTERITGRSVASRNDI